MARLPDDLLRPEAWPERPPSVELRETHISWVLLSPTRVVKVKKPVDFGFLDFSTLERRRRMCLAELRVNRRLAPETYLGLRPIVRREGRYAIGQEGDEAVEWAVEMVRLPDEACGEQMLARGELDVRHVEELARHLVGFHREAARSEGIAAAGSPAAISELVEENFDQAAAAAAQVVGPEVQARIEARQRQMLVEHAARFEARVETGRVCDGHGDLRLEHVYWRKDGPPVILDGIEFDPAYRWADVAADLAFVAMDLAWHRRADLAERLLAVYAREAGDHDLYGVIDFYQAYRAYVRAKIALFRLQDESASHELRATAREQARRYLRLADALEAAQPLREPVVVAVGGLIGTGKSTVADALAVDLRGPVVDADRVRKQLWGVHATQRLHTDSWSGPYDPAFTEEVYAELRRRARVVLDSGRPVVLDASFRSAEQRSLARDLARSAGAFFLMVECQAPRELCLERVAQRVQGPTVSDGRVEIWDDFAARWEPIREDAAAQRVCLDTTRPLLDSVDQLRQALGVER